MTQIPLERSCGPRAHLSVSHFASNPLVQKSLNCIPGLLLKTDKISRIPLLYHTWQGTEMHSLVTHFSGNLDWSCRYGRTEGQETTGRFLASRDTCSCSQWRTPNILGQKPTERTTFPWLRRTVWGIAKWSAHPQIHGPRWNAPTSAEGAGRCHCWATLHHLWEVLEDSRGAWGLEKGQCHFTWMKS